MSKLASRAVAIFLLVAFGGWLVMTIWPSEKSARKRNTAIENTTEATYEPKFVKEGELMVFDASSADTLAQFNIEIAEQPVERNYGMMYRKSMGDNEAMFFVMDREERQSFWMKNTYVSLDIIYINAAKEVVSIQKNAKPLDETSLPSEGPSLYVLEIRGGLSDKLNLKAGDKVVFNKF